MSVNDFPFYMFKQKNYDDLINRRNIRTRMHDAVVFETCKPNLEKYKKRCNIIIEEL